jgi:hypothetical protein
MSKAFATSNSSSRGAGTEARGPAPEEQRAAALAVEAGQANWSAPKASAAAIAHWPRLLGANISASLLSQAGETDFPRARSSTRRQPSTSPPTARDQGQAANHAAGCGGSVGDAFRQAPGDRPDNQQKNRLK